MGEPAYARVAARGSAAERAAMQRKGVPVGAVKVLADRLHLSETKVLQAIDLKPATYYRSRKASGRVLSRDQTETVTRFLRLHEMAKRSLPDPEEWLSSPSPHLEGATPLEYAATEDGGRVVESLLERIEHGSVA